MWNDGNDDGLTDWRLNTFNCPRTCRSLFFMIFDQPHEVFLLHEETSEHASQQLRWKSFSDIHCNCWKSSDLPLCVCSSRWDWTVTQPIYQSFPMCLSFPLSIVVVTHFRGKTYCLLERIKWQIKWDLKVRRVWKRKTELDSCLLWIDKVRGKDKTSNPLLFIINR